MKNFGSTSGLTVLAEDQSTPANGMVAYVTSSYNSGYQNGDIKGAFLSDTDDTDLVATELVTNGTFDTDLTGWTDNSFGAGTSTQSGGELVLTTGPAGVTDRSEAYQGFATEIGKSYLASMSVTSTVSDNCVLQVGTAPSAGNLLQISGLGVGTAVGTFVATTTTSYFTAVGPQSAGAATIDNISVKLADADRSVNNNGLAINGTVTRSPVATGADLVAYGGWSTTGAKNNYLYQPYNSDLDFGTNFCFITWVKVDGAVGSQDQHFFDLSPVDLSGRINVFWNHNAAKFQFAPGNGGTNVTTSSPGYGNWHQLVCTASASSTQIYLDGALSSTGAGGFNHVLQSDAYLTIGARTTEYLGNAYGLNGSVALMRLSKTIPSPEQIAKIYEDEKVLFQDGAQATLYGSSDAVTALAYDDSTEILSVGTSSGRSDFQGLRRVNNTTNAVGAAISASNGMIVEE